MDSLFSDIDACILALVLAALMCGGWAYGCWRTRRTVTSESDDATGQLTNASVALLGLLLAFTFSMSLERHEHRRMMVVEHANTIGDFAACAAMQKEPVRGQLKELIRKYVEHLLNARKAGMVETDLLRVLAKDEEIDRKSVV